MLRDQAAGHGAVEAVVAGPVRLTIAELARRAGEAARGLIALGVSPGDRVGIWAPNTPEWVISAYGVWDAGAVVAPLSTRFKGIEAGRMLHRVGARVLFVAEGFMDTSFLGMLAEAYGEPAAGRPFGGLPDLRHVITFGRPSVPPRPGVLPWADFAARGAGVPAREAERRALAVREDDLAEIMATSGTTGAPKGVMLPHGQLLRGYWDWAEIVTLGEEDRYPIIAPFSHGFGINAGLLACVLKRATMIPVALFAPDELMDLIERDRISVLAGPPTLFHRILDELGTAGRDVSSLRVAICGAAAVPPELIRRLLDRVGLKRMINAYGLMEGTVVSMTRAEDPVEVIAGSTGRAVPGVSLRIVDDAGRDLPHGERGEILVGGYGVMPGYWDDPEKTAEVVDADGWLHTGDIGVLDERGDLAVVDRKKEMFIVGGFNAYPAEIEALLLHHPNVAQAAVIGVADARLGEVGWAYVVPRPGAVPEPGAVLAWARENMSNYKVPRRVIVVDALPANVNGKVDKPALRARAATAR
ncbi:AMP-binding protein [Actinomadura alba]|uniref:AMP-binding protein n=1 Tax=Actinomadura alba TaxID=406431 RepID=A0ABR7LHE7_9ACTN|nr:AMP-binding protein [Actinomadura alba]MBC6464103.1 AMP-binding protein [Actinomadura alba]